MSITKKINIFDSYLLLFLPIALLTGPFIPDLFVSFLAISFIAKMTIQIELKYFNNLYFKVLLFFIFILILSSLLSKNIFFSLESSLVYFRFCFFSIAVWYLLDKNPNIILKFKYYLLISLLIAIFAGSYQYIFSETIFGYTSPSNRLLLLTSDQQLLGQYLARLFPLFVAVFFYQYRNSWSNIFIITFVFITIDVIIYLSGERTALGLLFLSSFCILFLVTKLKLLRIFTILVSVMIIILISIFDQDAKERNIDYTIKQLGINNADKNINIFSPEHERIILTAYNMFKLNPLLGVGPNNFRNLCQEEEYEHVNDLSCQTHPHNSLVQLLAETGAIGATIPISIFFCILYIFIMQFYYFYCKRKPHYSNFQICLLICFFSTLWPFLPSLNVFNNWINIIYYLPVGFYLHTLNIKTYKHVGN